jgi:hypothetical protein
MGSNWESSIFSKIFRVLPICNHASDFDNSLGLAGKLNSFCLPFRQACGALPWWKSSFRAARRCFAPSDFAGGAAAPVTHPLATGRGDKPLLGAQTEGGFFMSTLTDPGASAPAVENPLAIQILIDDRSRELGLHRSEFVRRWGYNRTDDSQKSDPTGQNSTGLPAIGRNRAGRHIR